MSFIHRFRYLNRIYFGIIMLRYIIASKKNRDRNKLRMFKYVDYRIFGIFEYRIHRKIISRYSDIGALVFETNNYIDDIYISLYKYYLIIVGSAIDLTRRYIFFRNLFLDNDNFDIDNDTDSDIDIDSRYGYDYTDRSRS